MCLPPANARICPNPLLYSAVYHRYSLKSFQLCKSAQTYWYRKYFEHIVARFQGDSSCLTIDNIKPELCRNSAPLYNLMSVEGLASLRLNFFMVEGLFSLEYSFLSIVFQISPSVIHPRVESMLSVQNL